MIVKCPDCKAQWGGTSAAHCARAGCHLTLSGITAFDFHQVGERCRSRRELFGLSYREVRPGVIGLPSAAYDPKERQA